MYRNNHCLDGRGLLDVALRNVYGEGLYKSRLRTQLWLWQPCYTDAIALESLLAEELTDNFLLPSWP